MAVEKKAIREGVGIGSLFRRDPEQGIVKEIIGRSTAGEVDLWSIRNVIAPKTIDETRPDYEFWDKFRRGKALGYKLGALFAKPIIDILSSWEMGQGFVAKLEQDKTEDTTDESVDVGETDDVTNNADANMEYTNAELADFLNQNHALMVDVEKDKLGLGDQFVIVNPDSTLSVAPPNTVKVSRDPIDYRRIVAYTITTKTGEYTIEDQYRSDGRTVTISKGSEKQIFKYENLIGEIPVIHFANERSNNEVFGHPVYEALLPLCEEYDDICYKMIDGAKLMGNPIPSIEGLEDLSQVENANDTQDDEEYTDKDGNTENRKTLRFDKNALFLIGKGGALNFKGPAIGFTDDTRNVLKALFLLALDHTRIPEYLWGGAIASSMASAETQEPPFLSYIQERQKGMEEPILRLLNIWLMTKALIDPQVVTGDLTIEWLPIKPETADVTLRKIGAADGMGLITKETALEKLDLVDNPQAEIEKAKEEAQQAQDEFQRRLGQELNAVPPVGNPDEQQSADGGNGNGNGNAQPVPVGKAA
jgi:hypothetical protein